MDERLIYTRAEDGGLSVMIPAPGMTKDDVLQHLPADAINPQWVVASALPTCRTFRDAWSHGGEKVDIDIDGAKQITHERRRAARATEFAPLDDAIAKQLPGKSAIELEADRAAVREKYKLVQEQIEKCESASDLLDVITTEGL